MYNETIAIYASKSSEKVITFCTGVSELMKYCSEKQANNIQNAANSGRLHGAYFTKSGIVRASYKW